MQNYSTPDQTTWGIHLNFEGHFASPPNPPSWLTQLQQQDWQQHRRRWKVERLFAWLQNYRRILVRYDRFLENYLAFVYLACIVIFIRNHF